LAHFALSSSALGGFVRTISRSRFFLKTIAAQLMRFLALFKDFFAVNSGSRFFMAHP
jgi:hypothetical protein